MKYFLSKNCYPIAVLLAKERTLCAFDFDGTLSSIVEHPDQATLRVRTRHLLGRLATLYPCIIVSGRARADALEKLGDVTVARVIGNHGAEANAAQGLRQQAGQWKDVLEREIGMIPGVWIEDKGISLSIHYRQSSEKRDARRRLLVAAGKLQNAYVFGGKQVINIVMHGAPNKGDALATERDCMNCNWVLYVGDDKNDEDAFAMSGNIVSVSIGRRLKSRASYYLRSQIEIDDLLELLVRLREKTAPAQDRPSASCA